MNIAIYSRLTRKTFERRVSICVEHILIIKYILIHGVGSILSVQEVTRNIETIRTDPYRTQTFRGGEWKTAVKLKIHKVITLLPTSYSVKYLRGQLPPSLIDYAYVDTYRIYLLENLENYKKYYILYICITL